MRSVSSDVMDLRPLHSMKGFFNGLVAVVLISLLSQSAFAKEAKVRVVAVITGGEMMGHLKDPSGLFFDEEKKRLYISDSGNKRLLSYSFNQEIRFHAEFTHKDLGTPIGIVKDKRGYFYTVDSEKGEVLFIDPAKEAVVPIDLEGVMPGRMTIDGKGRLYVVDRLKKRILVLDTDRKVEKEILLEDTDISGINDIRVYGEGRIYLLDTIDRRIYIINRKGDLLASFGSGDFLFPVSLAVSDKGSVYVADGHGGRIFVFNRDGDFQYTFSRKGARTGELYHPSYITVDREGRIYVIDGDRVQIFQEIMGR